MENWIFAIGILFLAFMTYKYKERVEELKQRVSGLEKRLNAFLEYQSREDLDNLADKMKKTRLISKDISN